MLWKGLQSWHQLVSRRKCLVTDTCLTPFSWSKRNKSSAVQMTSGENSPESRISFRWQMLPTPRIFRATSHLPVDEKSARTANKTNRFIWPDQPRAESCSMSTTSTGIAVLQKVVHASKGTNNQSHLLNLGILRLVSLLLLLSFFLRSLLGCFLHFLGFLFSLFCWSLLTLVLLDNFRFR